MYFIVYKTTNLINGRIYVGVHRTTYLNDGYLGSGMKLREAIEKYGRDNFEREILHFCESAEEMFEMEAQIVNDEFVNDKSNYNIQLGGVGGPKDPRDTDYYKSGAHLNNAHQAQEKAVRRNLELKQRRIDAYYADPNRCANCDDALEYDKKRNKFCGRSCAATSSNTGRTVSEEQKRKISEALMSDKTKATLEARAQRKLDRENKLSEMKELVYSLNLDYSKRGWVTEFSNRTGISLNAVKKWLHKNMPDVYEQAYE